MILNRFDYDEAKQTAGIGVELLREGARDMGLTAIVCKLAAVRRGSHGNGVLIIDGGANIGSYTIPWARFLTGWGRVIAFEPQEWPFYALCGNLALNNCLNVEAHREALAFHNDGILVPFLDPTVPHNFGGCALGGDGDWVPTKIIDDMALERLDILKLDVEGMEPDAIKGAQDTIKRCRPVIIAEHFICGHQAIFDLLPEYACIGIGPDLLCVHKDEQNPALMSAMCDLAKQLNMQVQ
jgi:FkbM family methyltransferase